MSTIREQIIAAAIVALNTGTPGGVPQAERSRRSEIAEGATAKTIGVSPVKDVQQSVVFGTIGPFTRSNLTLAIEMRAPGTDTTRPDSEVDPLYEWIVKALGGSVLGGLALDIVEGDSAFEYGGGEYPYVMLTTEMVVSYQHVVNDPTRRT